MAYENDKRFNQELHGPEMRSMWDAIENFIIMKNPKHKITQPKKWKHTLVFKRKTIEHPNSELYSLKDYISGRI